MKRNEIVPQPASRPFKKCPCGGFAIPGTSECTECAKIRAHGQGGETAPDPKAVDKKLGGY